MPPHLALPGKDVPDFLNGSMTACPGNLARRKLEMRRTSGGKRQQHPHLRSVRCGQVRFGRQCPGAEIRVFLIAGHGSGHAVRFQLLDVEFITGFPNRRDYMHRLTTTAEHRSVFCPGIDLTIPETEFGARPIRSGPEESWNGPQQPPGVYFLLSMAISSVGSRRKSVSSAMTIVIDTRIPSAQLSSNPDAVNTRNPSASTTVVVANAWPTAPNV